MWKIYIHLIPLRVYMHNHVSACVSSLRDIPGILHSGCSITLESLLHFYSLLFPCTLHKIITRDLGWTLHSLAACEGSFMLISSEQNSWITVVLCMHPHLRDQRSATWKKKKNHFEHAYKVVLILLLNFFFSSVLSWKASWITERSRKWL